MADIMNKVPPHNQEAEQSVLGAILIDKEAMMKIADKITGEDFYHDKHRIIYDIMVELSSRHEPIDLLSLGNRLEEQESLKKIGGRSYLAELANIVPTAANVTHYANIVQKKATLRRLIGASSHIANLVYEQGDEDIEALLDEAERTMFGISQNLMKSAFTPLKSILTDAFERIDTMHKEGGGIRGVPSGYSALDKLLSGFQKSDLIILAARPSVGKTAFVLSMARYAAVKHKIPIGLFSLEMSKDQLVDRIICAEADIDLWKLRNGKLSDRDDDFPKLGRALGVLSEAPLYIDDSASANIMEIRAKCRRLQAEHGLGMIIIDYLQLMESRGNKENRVQEVSEISRGLKQIARELQVPVIALSQLSRTVESIKPSIPRLSHLRESGSIEQDADVVMFIYRKSRDKNYQPEELTPEEKNIAEIHVAKHRNGPVGEVKLFFDATRAQFKSLERSAKPPPQSFKAPVPKATKNPF